MTPALSFLLSALIGYLLGCINPAYLLARGKGVDIRRSGTGNLGASNSMVHFGWGWGILVALCDIGKAVLAVWLCSRLFPGQPLCREVAGTGCVLGHLYPFYLRFRGGKGFACFWGTLLALNWRLGLILAVVDAAVILASDYMVAGTVLTAVAGPLYFLWTSRPLSAAVLGAASALILWKHRENFRRLRKGTEIGLRRAHKGELRVKK